MLPSLVLIGYNGAGKTIFAKYVAENHGYTIQPTGPLWDEYAIKIGIIKSGKELSPHQRTELGLKTIKEHGNDFLIRNLLLPKLNPKSNYVIDSLRDEVGIDILRDYFGGRVVFVGVVADKEIRFKRVAKRDNVTRENFELREEQDSKYNVDGMLTRCKEVITNNHTRRKYFYRNIDEFLNGLKH